MLKKIFSVTLSTILLLLASFTNVSADSLEPTEYLGELVSIEYFDNGDTFEVYLSDPEDITLTSLLPDSIKSTNFITKTKTGYFKNASGGILWTVSIQGTFWYNGTTSECTSYVPSAKSYSTYWTINSVTGTKLGNTASATATAIFLSQPYTKMISISCSPTGVIS